MNDLAIVMITINAPFKDTVDFFYFNIDDTQYLA